MRRPTDTSPGLVLKRSWTSPPDWALVCVEALQPQKRVRIKKFPSDGRHQHITHLNTSLTHTYTHTHSLSNLFHAPFVQSVMGNISVASLTSRQLKPASRLPTFQVMSESQTKLQSGTKILSVVLKWTRSRDQSLGVRWPYNPI